MNETAKENPKDRRHETQGFTDGIRDGKGKLYKYTRKEQLFVFHYLTTTSFNGSAAAKAAGYDCSTDASFRNVAVNLLKKPHITAAINQAFEALTMPKHEILFRLGRIAAGEITDILNDDNELDIELAKDRGTAFLLKKVEIKRTRREITQQTIETPADAREPFVLESSILDETIKFEIHDPLRALELLGKHSRLFIERVESTGKDGKPLIPEATASVVVYLPDNGRGDGDPAVERSKAGRTSGETKRIG